jgi:Sigma-70 region 2
VDDRAEAEFEQFVHDRAPALLRVAFLLTDDPHAAEDLLQAALAKTFVAWRGLRHRQAADAYMRRVLVNTRTSQWRRRRVRETLIALPAVMHTVFAVNHPPIAGTGDTFLVRDRRNPSEPGKVEQISAFLPLRDGRCELVVVGRPGTTAVQYAEGGTGFAPLSTTDGVGRLPLATCEGHGAGRIRVLRGTEVAFEGPVDGAGHP